MLWGAVARYWALWGTTCYTPQLGGTLFCGCGGGEGVCVPPILGCHRSRSEPLYPQGPPPSPMSTPPQRPPISPTSPPLSPISAPQPGCSGSADPAEYNLRSRTVLCGTCGQPADKSGAAVASSSSSTSTVTVSRGYRSSGGGIGEGLLGRSYVLGGAGPRRHVSGGGVVVGGAGIGGGRHVTRCSRVALSPAVPLLLLHRCSWLLHLSRPHSRPISCPFCPLLPHLPFLCPFCPLSLLPFLLSLLSLLPLLLSLLSPFLSLLPSLSCPLVPSCPISCPSVPCSPLPSLLSHLLSFCPSCPLCFSFCPFSHSSCPFYPFFCPSCSSLSPPAPSPVLSVPRPPLPSLLSPLLSLLPHLFSLLSPFLSFCPSCPFYPPLTPVSRLPAGSGSAGLHPDVAQPPAAPRPAPHFGLISSQRSANQRRLFLFSFLFEFCTELRPQRRAPLPLFL